MSTSWSNDSISFGSINKTASGAPILNDAFLFPAADNQSFFQFGGETNYLFSEWLPPPVSLWQFTLDGKGNGSWSEWNAGRDSGFNNITRPARSLAATVDDTFFMVGGTEDSHSSQSSMRIGNSVFPLGGVLALNMTTGIVSTSSNLPFASLLNSMRRASCFRRMHSFSLSKAASKGNTDLRMLQWSNSSIPSHLVRPNGMNALLNSVPNFGPVGLLLAAGTGTVDNAPRRFDNITVYEPSDKTWHNQIATGDIPAGRDAPCTVGIQGDNGTYEMSVITARMLHREGCPTDHIAHTDSCMVAESTRTAASYYRRKSLRTRT